jgi:hypothetical protein
LLASRLVVHGSGKLYENKIYLSVERMLIFVTWIFLPGNAWCRSCDWVLSYGIASLYLFWLLQVAGALSYAAVVFGKFREEWLLLWYVGYLTLKWACGLVVWIWTQCKLIVSDCLGISHDQTTQLLLSTEVQTFMRYLTQMKLLWWYRLQEACGVLSEVWLLGSVVMGSQRRNCVGPEEVK